jgi:hypothetical protein
MTLWKKGYVASMWTYETINDRPTLSIHQHGLHIISMHQGIRTRLVETSCEQKSAGE